MNKFSFNVVLVLGFSHSNEPNYEYYPWEFVNDDFNLENTKIKKNFRLKTNQVEDFMDIVHNFMPDRNRITSIDVETKVCIV